MIYIWFVNVDTSRYIGSHLQFVGILMLRGNLNSTLWFGVHKLVHQTNVQHLKLFEMKSNVGINVDKFKSKVMFSV
jgi:predicted glycosyltransferase involved in capsule biosynthesis